MSVWYPVFDGYPLYIFRVGGPGLGNLLFPWARALLAAKQNGGEVVFPQWKQIKIGPFLRGEKDMRSYSCIFRPAPGDLSIFEGFVEVLRRGAVAEGCGGAGGKVTLVKGLGDYFSPLIENRNIVVDEFRKRLTSKYSEIFDSKDDPRVAIHVRRGDFREPTDINDSNCTRTPLKWYVDMVNRIHYFDPKVEFLVFSDGTSSELSELLNISGVSRSVGGDAMSDILRISKCKALIASGSTFSMWGAYIGLVPLMYFHGQKTQTTVGCYGLFDEVVNPATFCFEDFKKFLREDNI